MTLPSWATPTHEINLADPNDPGATPDWHDVTARVIDWSSQRGRQDNTTDVSPGSLKWKLRNDDSAFDPGNTAGPYYPNLVDWRAGRTKVTWAGVTYPVAFGYARGGWPQSYDMSGRRAWCEPTFVDAFTALGQIPLTDALVAEMLLDLPLSMWLLDETGGLVAGSTAATRQQVAPLVNIGKNITWDIVSPPGFFYDGVNTAEFADAGIIPTSSATALTFTTGSASLAASRKTLHGAYLGLPSGAYPTSLGSGFSIEFWFRTDPLTTSSGTAVAELLKLSGSSTADTLSLFASETAGVSASMTASGSTAGSADTSHLLLDRLVHHGVITVDSTGKNLLAYIDGAQVTQSITATASALNVAALDSWRVGQVSIQNVTNVNANPNVDPSPISTTIQALAIYPTVLSAARVSAHYHAGYDGFAGDTVGARVNRLLGYGAWPAAYASIDTTSAGDLATTLQGASDLNGKTLLAAIQEAVTSGNGDLDVDGQGRVRYRSRDYRFGQTGPAYTLGEGAGEQAYADPAPTIGLKPERTANVVHVSQVNGITINRGSSASELVRFPQGKQISVTLKDPEQIIDYADDQLRRFAVPQDGVDGLTFTPAARPSLWPTVLSLDFGTRVQVKRRPNSSASPRVIDAYVEGVNHDVTPTSWKVTVPVSPAPPFFPWVLGDATYGVLGSTTAPGF